MNSPLHIKLEAACQGLYDVFTEAGGCDPTEAVAHIIVDVFDWSASVIDIGDRNVRDLVKDELEQIHKNRSERRATPESTFEKVGDLLVEGDRNGEG